MENGDLKRYYKVNNQDAKDFVRLNADGKIPPELIDGGGTTVVANPTGEATADLTKLQVDTTIYGIPEGTNVVANPTLAGTESALTGLQVGDTKYKVDSGSEIHTYTANTTITQSGQPELYNQLKDDIAHYRAIKIGRIIFYYQMSSGQTHHYISQDVDTGNSINPVYLYSITEYTTSYQISVATQLWLRPTEANPTLSGVENNLDSILIGSSKYKLGYLPLSGGTMTGHILMNGDIYLQGGSFIRDNSSNPLLYKSGTKTNIGTGSSESGSSVILNIDTSAYAKAAVKRGQTEYNILDAFNTSANPALAGTETSLTSLKLNGTNYAIAGGTQVTFVDWS